MIKKMSALATSLLHTFVNIIVTSKVKCHSKAKRMAPAHPLVLRQIRGVVHGKKIVHEKQKKSIAIGKVQNTQWSVNNQF